MLPSVSREAYHPSNRDTLAFSSYVCLIIMKSHVFQLSWGWNFPPQHKDTYTAHLFISNTDIPNIRSFIYKSYLAIHICVRSVKDCDMLLDVTLKLQRWMWTVASIPNYTPLIPPAFFPVPHTPSKSLLSLSSSTCVSCLVCYLIILPRAFFQISLIRFYPRELLSLCHILFSLSIRTWVVLPPLWKSPWTNKTLFE